MNAEHEPGMILRTVAAADPPYGLRWLTYLCGWCGEATTVRGPVEGTGLTLMCENCSQASVLACMPVGTSYMLPANAVGVR